MKGEHGQLYFLQTNMKVEPNLNDTYVPSSDHVWKKDQTKESGKGLRNEHGLAIHSNGFELVDFIFLVFTRRK